MNVYKRVLHSLLPFWKEILTAGIFLLGAIGVSLLLPWPMKLLIDNVLGSKPLSPIINSIILPITRGDKFVLLTLVCISFLMVEIFHGIFSMLHKYIMDKVGVELVHSHRAALYSHLQKLSVGFHSKRNVGDSIYRVIVDTNSFNMILNGGFLPIVSSTFTLVGIFIIMVRLDPILTFVSMLVIPLIYLTIIFFSPRIEKSSKKKIETESKVTSAVQEAVSTIKAIIAFGREQEKTREFESRSDETLKATLDLTISSTLFSFIIGLIIGLGTAIVVWLGAAHVLEGTLTVGSIIVFVSYLSQLYSPVRTMSYIAGTLKSSSASAERIYEILDTIQDVGDDPNPIPISGVKEHVEFKNVTFGYDLKRAVLKSISFRAGIGETIAIVGPTGAGKSTLVNLIPRFYDPLLGEIFIDGINIKKFKLSQLRSLVGVVLQEMILFSASVKENILFGQPNATMDEVIASARASGAHDFIMNLPDGYDTYIGEKGVRLSGGQQQRITIARAFLKDAPILIMDEPTAALDSESEAIILDSLERLMQDKTVFVIAHRLSTIRDADRILVMKDGQIVEQGTHSELIKKRGYYHHFYDLQFLLKTKAEKAVAV